MSQLSYESRGEFVVDTRSTAFGDVLKHGVDDLCLYMVLPNRGGWKPLSYYEDAPDGSVESGVKGALLAHQTYQKHVESYLDHNPYTREVAVVSLDSGQWKTVWLRDGVESRADSRGRD